MRRVVIILFVFLQTLLYANTYGPSAPEVSKFEPFDVTQLVDLYTGDFIYTLPVMEVPGSGGSYPLTLSYKAGIPTNDVASWVGLGWNLTPGFLSRQVSGMPDDFYNKRMLRMGKHKYHAGVSIGFGDYVSAGMQYDNVQGQSGTVSVNVYSELATDNIGINVSVSGSRSGFSASGSVSYGSIGDDGFNSYMSASSGVTIGTSGFSMNSSVSASQVGFSVSSANITPSVSISIAAGSGGGQSGDYGIIASGLLYSDQFIKETEGRDSVQLGADVISIIEDRMGIKVIGSILDDWTIEELLLAIDTNYSFDEYFRQVESIVQKAEMPATWVSTPDDHIYHTAHVFIPYDNYSVNAQGVGGAIMPIRNNASTILTRADIFNRSPNQPELPFLPTLDHCYLNYYIPEDQELHDDTSATHQFRFVGDPGASYTSGDGEMIASKRISYTTDPETKLITSFTVVKEDGVVYTFGKPVYNLKEATIGFVDDNSTIWDILALEAPVLGPFSVEDILGIQGTGVDYSVTVNKNKYAYTWLLTSIQGPDYIDVNNNQIIDTDDYGYWVRFNYKSEPDIPVYAWREPWEGVRPAGIWNDEIPEERLRNNYSIGEKEVYYLNSVETNSHVAVFETSVRKDAYSTTVLDSVAPDMVQRITAHFHGEEPFYISPFSSGGLISLDSINLFKLDNVKLYRLSQWADISDSGESHIVDEGEISGDPIKIVDFDYSYDLCLGTPNSNANEDEFFGDRIEGRYVNDPGDGKLTLKTVTFRGPGGKNSLPPYVFGYDEDDETANPVWNRLNWDRWGMYKDNDSVYTGHRSTSPSNAAAWSLKSILTPQGAELKVDYESDEYFRVQNTLSADALDYEGDVVDVQYVRNNDIPQKLIGLILPISIGGRLRPGDTISFDADEVSFRFFQSDYTDKVNQILGEDGLNDVFGVIDKVSSSVFCSVMCGAWGKYTPGYFRCKHDCEKKEKECRDKSVVDVNGEFENRADMWTNSLGSVVNIEFEQVTVTAVEPVEGRPNKIRILFDEKECPPFDVEFGLFPISFGLGCLGDRLFSVVETEISEVMGELVEKLGGSVNSDDGGVMDIVFPMASSMKDVWSNQLHLSIKKNGSIKREELILAALKDSIRSADVFRNNYYVPKFGGGVRVKALTLADGLGQEQQWNYFYDFLGNGTGMPSGVTTCEPLPFAHAGEDDRIRELRQEEDGNFYLPSPSVGYEKVTVLRPDSSLEVHEFYTAADFPYRSIRAGAGKRSHKYFNPYVIYGKPKEKRYFAAGDSTSPVYEETYTYGLTAMAGTYIGNDTIEGIEDPWQVSVIKDDLSTGNDPLGSLRLNYENHLLSALFWQSGHSTVDSFIYNNGDCDNCLKQFSNSFQYDIPGLILANHQKTVNGVTTTIANAKFIERTGDVFSQVTRNSDASTKITTVTPAFMIYDGMKDKNMLTQMYDSIVFNGVERADRIIKAKRALWSTGLTSIDSSIGPWYKARVEQYEDDDGANTPRWIPETIFTKYNSYGKVESEQNGVGDQLAILYDRQNRLVSAVVKNALYGEALFAGFEDWDDAHLLAHSYGYLNGTERVIELIDAVYPDFAPNGKTYLRMKKYNTTDQYTVTPLTPDDNHVGSLEGQTYLFEFWAKADSAASAITHLQTYPNWQLHGASASARFYEVNLTTEWKKYSFPVVFSGADTSTSFRAVMRPPTTIGRTACYDGIRIYPADATMTAYTYDYNHDKVNCIIDENNNPKKFQYDSLGRLLKVFDDENNTLNQYEYYLHRGYVPYSKIRNPWPAHQSVGVAKTDNGWLHPTWEMFPSMHPYEIRYAPYSDFDNDSTPFTVYDDNFIMPVDIGETYYWQIRHGESYGPVWAFSIAPVKLLSPNGKEILTIGDQITIKWNGIETTETVDILINYNVDSAGYVPLAANIPITDEEFTFTLNATAVSHNVKIRIVASNSGDIYAESKETFSVTWPPTASVGLQVEEIKFNWNPNISNVLEDAITIRKNFSEEVPVPEFHYINNTESYAAYLAGPRDVEPDENWIKTVKVKLKAIDNGVPYSGNMKVRAIPGQPGNDYLISALGYDGSADTFTNFIEVSFAEDGYPNTSDGFATFVLAERDSSGVYRHLTNKVHKVNQTWAWQQELTPGTMSDLTGPHNFYFIYDDVSVTAGNTSVFKNWPEYWIKYDIYKQFLPWADLLEIACELVDVPIPDVYSGEVTSIVDTIEYSLYADPRFSAQGNYSSLDFSQRPYRHNKLPCSIYSDSYAIGAFDEFFFNGSGTVSDTRYENMHVYNLTEAISRINNAGSVDKIYYYDTQSINLKVLVMLCADVLGATYPNQITLECDDYDGGAVSSCPGSDFPAYVGQGNEVDNNFINKLLIK